MPIVNLEDAYHSAHEAVGKVRQELAEAEQRVRVARNRLGQLTDSLHPANSLYAELGERAVKIEGLSFFQGEPVYIRPPKGAKPVTVELVWWGHSRGSTFSSSRAVETRRVRIVDGCTSAGGRQVVKPELLAAALAELEAMSK
jgi:hypothetical protein